LQGEIELTSTPSAGEPTAIAAVAAAAALITATAAATVITFVLAGRD
jgi:hypothetical protein